MVERCFNKLKNARRLATRYDKTADSYLGFIQLVAIRLWMRQFVNRS
ncbi:transposase, partial [Parasphingorhabdus sp.]|jgi:transposase